MKLSVLCIIYSCSLDFIKHINNNFKNVKYFIVRLFPGSILSCKAQPMIDILRAQTYKKHIIENINIPWEIR